MDENTAYRRLADAIILKAVKDYRHAIGRLEKNPKDIKAKVIAEECKTFFRSDWFYVLAGMDGDYLLEKLCGDTTKTVRYARHNTKHAYVEVAQKDNPCSKKNQIVYQSKNVFDDL